MKLPKIPSGFRVSQSRNVSCACLLGLALVSSAVAAPTVVDTELLLLIDVSGSISDAEFDYMMDAYGRAMTSTSVIDAIQSGQTGRIATSVMFWGGAKSQTVGVSWMEVSDLSTATAFSSIISEATRPFMGRTAIGSAIDAAVPLFGTETGAAENGFHSASQIIDVAGDGPDNDTPNRVPDRGVNVAHARDAALSQGVDMINGLAVNDRTRKLSDYYSTYVIGGKVGDTTAFVENADSYDAFEDALVRKLVAEIKAGGTSTKVLQTVPEPSLPLLGSIAGILLLLRRRR